ncbi:hypothetical protein BCR35DRAFT_223055 [Leucosporidium creatinivorum]|uniref:F-box domain-containing protein n=1 Tax=Leucosporidium creatinivorum TaxID=106004 RepID=A0A1Y2D7B4_9BASI|nr:hypothetical protein BCR35DRAFT_223055 [Leucosporidium creatinivorum]
MSLVCSLWRDEAQKLLWKLVVLSSNEGCRSFQLSGESGRTSFSLVFRPNASTTHFDGLLVRRAIEATHGLKSLELNHVEELHPQTHFVSSFTTNAPVPLLFKQLPSLLEELYLMTPRGSDPNHENAIALLKSGTRSISKLKRLSVSVVGTSAGWKKLGAECQRRGIKLEREKATT